LKDEEREQNTMNDSVYSRIISAAVINERFCNLLLNDPEKAITNGYSGETFEMNSEDKMLLSSIRANNLSDFALQLVQARLM
jgi:hypothetical protein